MPYPIYKLMHYVGIFTMLVAFTLACAHAMRASSHPDRRSRRGFAITSGVALLLILTGGFGMLARLGIVQGGLPGWVLVKLGIWLALAAAIAAPLRGRQFARALMVAVPLAALLAAAVALFKPLMG